MFDGIKSFFSNRREGRIEKYARSVKNPKAIKEDRIGAIDFFANEDDPSIAVPALLLRFEFSLEHGINDTKEKESAMAGIVRHGDKALPFVQTHLKSTTRIAWPIKVLAKIANEAEVVAALKGALNFGEVAFDQAQVDKNYDVLCYLRDFQLPGYAVELAHFLRDPDERVRFATAEALIEQDDPQVAELLEPFLADDSAENLRIRRAALDAFAAKKWKLSRPDALPDGKLPPGFALKGAGIEHRP